MAGPKHIIKGEVPTKPKKANQKQPLPNLPKTH